MRVNVLIFLVSFVIVIGFNLTFNFKYRLHEKGE